MPNPDYNEKVKNLFPPISEKQEKEFKKKLMEEFDKKMVAMFNIQLLSGMCFDDPFYLEEDDGRRESSNE